MTSIGRMKLDPTLPYSIHSLLPTDMNDVRCVSADDFRGVFADQHWQGSRTLDVAYPNCVQSSVVNGWSGLDADEWVTTVAGDRWQGVLSEIACSRQLLRRAAPLEANSPEGNLRVFSKLLGQRDAIDIPPRILARVGVVVWSNR
jgi:hypothetical protein